jgi:predicted XRE-type DNA-binding protein
MKPEKFAEVLCSDLDLPRSLIGQIKTSILDQIKKFVDESALAQRSQDTLVPIEVRSRGSCLSAYGCGRLN